mgnify:CR=1 FL=1
MKVLILILVAVSIAAFWLGNRAAPPADNTPITQSESSGEVTVTATYQGDQIEVALDTHSVDLSNFDFGKSISPAPTSVQATTDSPHHRRAILKFNRLNLPFTLVISNLANIPQRKLVFERG